MRGAELRIGSRGSALAMAQAVLVSTALSEAGQPNRIVVITTEGGREDRERALRLGANAYITKPIQAPRVMATVKELLRIT